jgi:acyl carrier protein
VTRDEIQRQLIAIILEEKTVPEEHLKPEALLADVGIDSLDSLQILFSIEETFRISIPDTRARQIRTLGDMVDVVVELAA